VSVLSTESADIDILEQVLTQPLRLGKAETPWMRLSSRIAAFRLLDSRSGLTSESTASSKGGIGHRKVRSLPFLVVFPWLKTKAFIVIPDYAKMNWIVRAPSADEAQALRERIDACLEYVAISVHSIA
jgi:hypothetical protein